jgi:hypothetical protein
MAQLEHFITFAACQVEQVNIVELCLIRQVRSDEHREPLAVWRPAGGVCLESREFTLRLHLQRFKSA